MTTSLPLTLPYDKTAKAATNTITFEFHQAAFGQKALVKCDYGAFYSNSPVQPFQMFAQGAQNVLIPMVHGTDYELAEFDQALSTATGYAVYKAIVVLNTTLSGIYAVCYQAVGGLNNPNVSLTYQLAQNPPSSAGPTNFTDIEDRPATFTPGPHQHDVKDIYFGTEYLVKFLNVLAGYITAKYTAFPSGVKAKDAEIKAKMDNFTVQLAAYAAQMATNITAHVGNTGQYHAYTAQMVGLGNVVNGAFSAITVNGIPLPIYANPYAVGQAILNKPSGLVYTSHTGNTGNPHGTSAAQVGLGNVRNLGILTAYSTGNYVPYFAANATESYLSPYVVANGVADAQSNQLSTYLTGGLAPITTPSTGLLAQAQAANTAANTALTAANTALTNTTTSLGNANTAIANAKAANRHFNMVLGNALYAAVLKRIMDVDHAAYATHASAAKDGYYAVPPLFDSLYLWLDVNYSHNTYQNDGNGVSRLMTMVDRSTFARVYASNNLASAPIFRQSSDITQGVVGVSVGNVAVFTNGTYMDQISGAAVALQPGMTIFALVRPMTSDTPFQLLSETSLTSLATLTVQPSPGVAMKATTSGSWKPFLAAPGTIDASTSTLLCAGISNEAEQYNWLAGLKGRPNGYPQGTATQNGNVWPTEFTQSAPLTRIGNANSGTLNGGELVELIVYNRLLSFAEVQTVIAYLQLSKSNYQAFVVDTSVQYAF